MVNLQLIATLLRIAGILMLVFTLQPALFLGVSLREGPGGETLAAAAVVVAYLALAIMLVVAPLRCARLIVPGPVSDEDPHDSWSLDGMQAVLFSAVGAYLLADNVPEFLARTASLLVQDRTGWQDWSQAIADNLLYTTFYLVVGTWLLFGARGLRSVIRRVRTVGHG